jgi:hypothetical protein
LARKILTILKEYHETKIYKTLNSATLVTLIFSCQKDTIVDGGVSDPKVNMTTYDYLKAHPKGLFDTLLLIVDKAQMKETINSKGTFIVPTDYSVNSYISLRQSQIRKVDERKDYTLDSLFKEFTPKMLKDSLSVYFFLKILCERNWMKMAENSKVVPVHINSWSPWSSMEMMIIVPEV